MAVNAGEVSLALTLDDGGLYAGLEGARASLEEFAAELSALAAPPDAAGAELPDWDLDASGRFAGAGAGAGRAFSEAAAARVAAGAGEMAEAAAGLVDAAAAPLGAAVESAASVGAQLSQACAGGIALGAPLAQAQASAMAQAAARAARGGLSSAGSIGRGFASGLAAGISAGRSGVISAAIGIARAAAAAARSALAIHSPSRVTERMGEFFDLGFIRGVEGMEPGIERAVRSAVYVKPPAGAAFGASGEAAPPLRVGGMSIDYDALAEAMNRRQMVLTMDNRRLAEVQERETARVQAARNRRIALGYGR